MADRSSSQTEQQDQQSQQQQSPESQDQSRSQPQFDSAFFEQMATQAGTPTGGSSPWSLGYDITSTVVQSYFEQIEAQTRQARRMADLWAQSLILQQTHSQIVHAVVPLAARQVVEYIKRDPALVKEFTQQR